jgi:hypothetical protein
MNYLKFKCQAKCETRMIIVLTCRMISGVHNKKPISSNLNVLYVLKLSLVCVG